MTARPPTFVPVPHPTDEVINRNLRAIQAAFTRIATAEAASSGALDYIGALAADGSLALPNGYKRIRLSIVGDATAGGTLSARLNSVAAGYLLFTPGVGWGGATAQWQLAAPALGGAFYVPGELVFVPAAAPYAMLDFNSDDLNTCGNGVGGSYVGALPLAAAPTSIQFISSGLTSYRVDAWAEMAT